LLLVAATDPGYDGGQPTKGEVAMVRTILLIALVLTWTSTSRAQSPDLSANSIFGPPSVSCGGTMSITRDITNVGIPFTGTLSYSIWLSTNNFISPSDLQIQSVMSTSPGGLGVVSLNVVLPNNVAPGFYFLGLVVDPAPGEFNTSNNVVASSSPLQVLPGGAPDLVANSITGPATATPGSVIQVTRNVSNQGCAITAPFTYNVRISADQIIDAGDPVIAAFSSVTLGALNINATLPSNLAPGTYWLALVVDPAAGEVATSNNQVLATNSLSVGNPFPGSGEDLLLETGVNGAPDSTPLKTAMPGDTIQVAISSPGGALSNTPPLLVGQVYPTGTPGPGSPTGFPEVYIDPALALLILNGTAPTPFGSIVIPPAGSALTLTFAYPGGLSGFTARVQAYAVTPTAMNGFFAASAALEIEYP